MLANPIAQRIEQWPLSRLVPYARNPRKNDHAVDRMAASIREFGFRVPVLARSSGDVIDGHLRLKAADKLGLTEISVIVCDDWSEAQVKAFRLLVNRSVNWADWDDELLSLEMLDLRNLDTTWISAASTLARLTNCSSPNLMIRTRMTLLPHLKIPHRGLATFGSAGSIESCARTPPARKQCPAYSGSASRGS